MTVSAPKIDAQKQALRDFPWWIAILAGALCYAIAGVWLKRHGAGLQPVAIAGWSQMGAAAALLGPAVGTDWSS